jgi:hypothetical protein
MSDSVEKPAPAAPMQPPMQAPPGGVPVDPYGRPIQIDQYGRPIEGLLVDQFGRPIQGIPVAVAQAPVVGFIDNNANIRRDAQGNALCKKCSSPYPLPNGCTSWRCRQCGELNNASVYGDECCVIL